ncbi:uncharacterized protein LOC102804993 [Saccoglossus kowalevskii]|uniref:Uncharacterized protein LOC102804993 n=1 Tax=Saccoglossus kowalevskii TaxID=10224 RepID=A0ABM0LYC7_SACKO|nr:PREDICTED: uncharacterized protein LOC102804993 [Saccoglossus kowalevskii]
MDSKRNSDIRYEVMKECHINEAAHILTAAFLHGEPLFQVVSQPYEAELSSNISLCTHCVKEGVSMVAIDNATGEVVGAATGILCHGNKIEDGHTDHPMVTPESTSFLSIIIPFLEELEKVFYKYPDFTNNRDCMVLSSSKIGVHKDYGGMGIGTKLARMRGELGRGKGVKFIVVACTGPLSQKLYSRLGYECIGEIVYKDYTTKGERPFAKITVCPAAKLFVKKY